MGGYMILPFFRNVFTRLGRFSLDNFASWLTIKMYFIHEKTCTDEKFTAVSSRSVYLKYVGTRS